MLVDCLADVSDLGPDVAGWRSSSLFKSQALENAIDFSGVWKNGNKKSPEEV